MPRLDCLDLALLVILPDEASVVVLYVNGEPEAAEGAVNVGFSVCSFSLGAFNRCNMRFMCSSGTFAILMSL